MDRRYLRGRGRIKYERLKRMAKRILEQQPVTITREVAEYAHAFAPAVAARDGQDDDRPFLDSRFQIACDENSRPLKHIATETKRKRIAIQHEHGQNAVAYKFALSKMLQETVEFDAFMVPASVLKDWRKSAPEGDLSFLPWLLWMFKDDATPELTSVTLTNAEAEEARDACVAITQRKGLGFDLIEAAARNVIALAPICAGIEQNRHELNEKHGEANKRGVVEYTASRRGDLIRFASESDQLLCESALMDMADAEAPAFQAAVVSPDVLDDIYDKNQKVGLGFIAATRDWMFRDLEKEARAAEREAAEKPKAKTKKVAA